MKINPYEIGFYLVFACVLAAFFIVVQPYLLLFFLAFCTAVTIMPLYKYMVRGVRSSAAAAILTSLLFLCGVIAPLGFFATIAVEQAATLANTIQTGISENPEQLAIWQSAISEFLPLDVLQNSLELITKASLEFIQKAAVPFAGSVIGFVINLVFFVVLLIIFLLQKDSLIAAAKTALPMQSRDANNVVDAIVTTIGPIMRSTVIVAATQASLGTFILAIFGVPSLVFFFFAQFFAAFIPLGSGLIIVPIGIIQLLLGNIVSGTAILLWHTFITSSSDNLVRSWLFKSGSTKLPELLTFIATLGGLSAFGILGVIFGPLIGVIYIVFYRLYVDKKTRWQTQ